MSDIVLDTSTTTTDTIDYAATDGTGTTVSCSATLTVSGGQCPAGKVLRAGVCVGACPVGYVQQGNECVFSACPSGHILQGTQCVLSNLCGTPPHCNGDSLVNSCTGAVIQSCAWGCTGSACSAMPVPDATLRAVPSLLHTGNTSTISRSASNVRACTVTGTNGDAWTGKSSTGKTSKAIQMQTTYYLHCDGYAGSSPASIDKSVIINIIPSFQEK